MESLQYSEVKKSVWDLSEDRELYDFESLIQRDEVWNVEQKSLLIHSFLVGYKVPELTVNLLEEGVRTVVDGLQRGTATLGYLDEEYALHRKTPDVDGVKVAGKKFSQLSLKMQKKLENSAFSITQYHNLNKDQLSELFRRLNNGKALTKKESTKAKFGIDVLEQITPVSKKDFVLRCVGKGGVKRQDDIFYVAQMLMLAYNDFKAVDVGGGSVNNFAEKVSKEGINMDILDDVSDTVDYLNLAIPESIEDVTDKSIEQPMIFFAATYAKRQNIAPEKFGGWVQSFYDEDGGANSEDYLATKQGGTAKKLSVAARMEIILNDLELNLADAPNYVSPNNLAESDTEEDHGDFDNEELSHEE